MSRRAVALAARPAALLAAALMGLGSGCARGARADLEHLPAQGALGPYSAAVCSGEQVWLSGKLGERGGSFERELETAIDALAAELQRLGLGLGDVAAVTVYLTDMSTYAELNAVYSRRFPQPWPARACVAVAALPGGARVELSATARRR